MLDEDDEVQLLRQEARAAVEAWRLEESQPPRSDNWGRGSSRTLTTILAQRALIGITWPLEYGGRGATNRARFAVTEELLRAGVPTFAHWFADRQIGPAILRYGSQDLKDELLRRITAGEVRFCLGMSEPDAGSDLASLRTSAKPVDGGFRISGRKTWTSGAHDATHMYLLARTDPDAERHAGLTEFVLDMDWPGIEVTPILDLSGEHHFNEVALDDVFVPHRRVLGEAGSGWQQVVRQLSFERGGPERYLSTYPLLATLVRHLPHLGDHAAGDIGELTARLAALRRLGWRVAALMDSGQGFAVEAATLKLLGNAFEQDVVGVAGRLLDPADPDYVDALLVAPAFSIRGGAAEVLLGLISREESRERHR